jgi:hypothetical protein
MNRGPSLAARRAFDKTLAEVYGLLRLALGTARAADEAIVVVCDRAADDLTLETDQHGVPTRAVLMALALDEVAARRSAAADPPVPRMAGARRRVPADFYDGLDDGTLSILVRTLPSGPREAVVLTVICGLPEERVAEVLGTAPAEAARLAQVGIDEVRGLLTADAAAHHGPADLAARPAPHLKSLPSLAADGHIVVRGTRAFLVPHGPGGLLESALLAFARLWHRLRRRHGHDHHLGGGPSRRSRKEAALPPTPTSQPIARPQLTPTLQPHALPEATAGTQLHKRSPHATPSTKRLSNPPRALPAGSHSQNSWARRK